MRSNSRLLTACERSPQVGDLLTVFDIAPSQAGAGSRSARVARVTHSGPDWFAYRTACPVLPPTPPALGTGPHPGSQPPIHGDDGLLPRGDGHPAGSPPEEVSCLIYAASWDLWHYVERADGGPVLWDEITASIEAWAAECPVTRAERPPAPASSTSSSCCCTTRSG